MDGSLEFFSRQSLAKLLDAGERAQAGARSRPAALTAANLSSYRSTKSLHEKEAFENIVLAASAAGAVDIRWDTGYVPKGGRSDGFISRIDLLDIEKLAEFLNCQLTADKVRQAESQFSPLLASHPVLSDVISRWSQLKTVRGLKPEDIDYWLDAAIVVGHTKSQQQNGGIFTPIRETSAKLFKDSKRIEKLASAVDILLSGDIDTEARQADEIWKEIGLSREELPVRLAGNVSVVRSRVTALLDAPYAAFPAESVLGLNQDPLYILSIENQTTFHSEARRLCQENVLLLYTNGMPSPKWRAMYLRVLASTGQTVGVRHWGDIDEGGFRIAAILANDAKSLGRTLEPEKMNSSDIPLEARRPASDGTIFRMHKYALLAGWDDLARTIQEERITVEQEAL